jgi:hypothetical protein
MYCSTSSIMTATGRLKSSVRAASRKYRKLQALTPVPPISEKTVRGRPRMFVFGSRVSEGQ